MEIHLHFSESAVSGAPVELPIHEATSPWVTSEHASLQVAKVYFTILFSGVIVHMSLSLVILAHLLKRRKTTLPHSLATSTAMDDDTAGHATGGYTTVAAAAHFVLVPMMAQGHAIPMTDMARLLAEHGAQVSLVVTPVNAARMAGFVAGVEEAGLPVQLVELPFPAAEFGLPDGCENVDLLPSIDLFSNFLLACGALREPLAARLSLRQRRTPVSCIIADVIHWWAGDIAGELGVPWLTFNGSCTFASFAKDHSMFMWSPTVPPASAVKEVPRTPVDEKSILQMISIQSGLDLVLHHFHNCFFDFSEYMNVDLVVKVRPLL